MPTSADFNSFTSQRVPGLTLGAGEHATVDGPVVVAVQPSARLTAVLVDSEDVPTGTPVIVAPGGTFSIGAGQRGMLTVLDPWAAAARLIWQ